MVKAQGHRHKEETTLCLCTFAPVCLLPDEENDNSKSLWTDVGWTKYRPP